MNLKLRLYILTPLSNISFILFFDYLKPFTY